MLPVDTISERPSIISLGNNTWLTAVTNSSKIDKLHSASYTKEVKLNMVTLLFSRHVLILFFLFTQH